MTKDAQKWPTLAQIKEGIINAVLDDGFDNEDGEDYHVAQMGPDVQKVNNVNLSVMTTA